MVSTGVVGAFSPKCLDALGAPTSVGEMADTMSFDFFWGGHGRSLDALDLTNLIRYVDSTILSSTLLAKGP